LLKVKTPLPSKILWYQSAGFLAIIALSWLDECTGFHTLVLGQNSYISDFRESTIEMLLALTVWLLLAGATGRLLGRLKHLESFMKVCAWCHRIEHKGHWIPLEEFLEQGFDTPTSHGICAECLQRSKAAIARARTSTPAPSAESLPAPIPGSVLPAGPGS
jgi:hypothetical protein